MIELEKQACELIARGSGVQQKLSRAWQIGTHYRWSQMARRGVSVLKNRLRGGRMIGQIAFPSELKLNDLEHLKPAARLIVGCRIGHSSHQYTDLKNGKLTLLNHTVNMGGQNPGIDWNRNLSDLPHLWRFQLQYHEYLMSWVAENGLIEKPTDPGWNLVWQTIDDWIKNFDPASTPDRSDAWHAYCISRRAVVWIWLLSLAQPEPELLSRIVESLYQQTQWLHEHLEHDLRGNHLFENLSTLVIVGQCLQTVGSKRWLKTATKYLQIELATQVLPHGEHFELSPMYHCQILGNLQRMAIVTKNDSRATTLSELCNSFGLRMLQFLNQIVCPDNEIPLLSDSGFDEAPDVSQIRKLAKECAWDLEGGEPKDAKMIRQCGPYWIADGNANKNCHSSQSEKADWLLFDRGEICPDGLPAHGHCDLTNVVASVGGRRWLVDSGNFDYQDGSMRQYCRSSLGHNVVTVDGSNQCNIWSKFRMGYRGRMVSKDQGRTGDFHWASATHDGYRRQGASKLLRIVAVNLDNSCWICADKSIGRRHTALIGYLHFDPSVQIQSLSSDHSDRSCWLLDDGISRRQITFFGVDHADLKDGWVCSGFGRRSSGRVLVYRSPSTDSPKIVGWLLHPENSKINSLSCLENRLSVEGEVANQTVKFDWKFD